MLIVEDVDLTPNPHALKFILNEKLLSVEKRHFSNSDESNDDPLAKGIFDIDGVASVFYMENFVTIEKEKDADWSKIQMPFINLLKTFDKNLIPEEAEIKYSDENDSELLKQINSLIDVQVRPALASDGGGLEVLSVINNIVKIKYQGACGTCPTAISGTLAAIENLLQRNVDPTLQVISA